MPLQLVLQFRADALQHFHRIENLSEQLTSLLEDSSSLDGEDVGSHGANLFFFTDDPKAAFERAETLLGAKSLAGYAAAYRQISSERFHRIWPLDDVTEFRLR